MMKTLFAVAAAALANLAAAQGSVTVFGILDVDLARFSQNGVSKTMVSHSGNSPSTLGFRGSEDLGSGLSAHFWLSGSLSPDDGSKAMDWGFRSTVSLASSFGEIRLGRDYPVASLNQGVFDPFRNMGPASGANITLPVVPNVVGTGVNPATAIRVSNSIQYLWGFAPNALAFIGKGFYGDVMVGLPENASGTSPLGRYTGARVGYAVGPWNVAAAYAESVGPFGTMGPNYKVATMFKESNLGGSYTFSGVKLMGHIGTTESNIPNMPNMRYSHWAVGGEISVGNGYIPLSYISRKQNNAAGSSADQIAAGYVYHFSKRTALYTSVSRITNKNGATYTFIGGNGGNFPALTSGLVSSPGNGSAYDLGVRHSF